MQGGKGLWVLFIVVFVLSVLRVLQYCGSVRPAAASSLMRTTDGSNVVDLYNVTTGTWSTAQLSATSTNLAATSVGNVALFAGGGSGALLFREWAVGIVYCCVRVLCFARAAVLRFCSPCGRFLSHAHHRWL